MFSQRVVAMYEQEFFDRTMMLLLKNAIFFCVLNMDLITGGRKCETYPRPPSDVKFMILPPLNLYYNKRSTVNNHFFRSLMSPRVP